MKTIFTAVILWSCLANFSAFADAVNLSIGFATADFKAAKAAGFDYAEARIREFMKLSDADFKNYVAACRSNGLPLTTAYWFLPTDLKVVGPDVKLDAVTNYFVKALDRCQTLGVKIIVWGSGPARQVPDNFSRERAFDQLVALGKFLAPEAAKRGITIVAEPIRKQECNFINTATEGLQWVEAVNHPNFQLLVDIFHMTEEHEDMGIIVKAGPHIAHVHFSNPKGRVLPVNAAEFDYAPFLGALKKIGYHGTLTIETSAVNLAADGPKAIEFVRAAYTQAGNEK
jgi:sugar phosphate isomerase/epimerase